MFIASTKRKENIAEYLLYMWQVEDLIRANDLNIDSIVKNVVNRYESLSDEQRKELTGWYESLIDMMRSENVAASGHLQLNRNVIAELTDLHKGLLADSKYSEYSSLYYKTLPYIVELRSRAGEMAVDEITTCFTALYGVLLLRLQKRKISTETAEAVKAITLLISTLSAYFHKNEEKPLFVAD